MTKQPNMVLILTDQQHFGMLGCTGNPYVRTPALDGLADGGVRFDRAYCTNPICVPSRFSLMTGLMPSAIGLRTNGKPAGGTVPESIRSNGLGHLLRRAGYEAVYAGKQHFPAMTAEDLGFECLCQSERDAVADSCAAFLHRSGSEPFLLVASFINPHDVCYMAIRDFAESDSERRLVANGTRECATLDQALQRPGNVDADTYFAQYCPPLPDNFEPQTDEPEAIGWMLEQRPFRRKAREFWSEQRWREHRWAYARLTELADRQIGHLLDALDNSGQAERTLVVFTSDHGDMDAAHRMEHKSVLYDESSRIPLIIRPPGGTQGRVDQTHLISNGLDLLPSFCDWAGIAPPTGLRGVSLRPLVEGAHPPSWRRCVPIETSLGKGIVTDRFKYAVYDFGKHREQVTDLAADPLEQRNALTDAGLEAQVGALRILFRETFEEQESVCQRRLDEDDRRTDLFSQSRSKPHAE